MELLLVEGVRQKEVLSHQKGDNAQADEPGLRKERGVVGLFIGSRSGSLNGAIVVLFRVQVLEGCWRGIV